MLHIKSDLESWPFSWPLVYGALTHGMTQDRPGGQANHEAPHFTKSTGTAQTKALDWLTEVCAINNHWRHACNKQQPTRRAPKRKGWRPTGAFYNLALIRELFRERIEAWGCVQKHYTDPDMLAKWHTVYTQSCIKNSDFTLKVNFILLFSGVVEISTQWFCCIFFHRQYVHKILFVLLTFCSTNKSSKTFRIKGTTRVYFSMQSSFFVAFFFRI